MLIHDARWCQPSNSIICGPSGSGKSSLLSKIVNNSNKLFLGKQRKILLYYLEDQNIYDEWKNRNLILHSQKGLPDLDSLKQITDIYKSDGLILIIDDLGQYIKSISMQLTI